MPRGSSVTALRLRFDAMRLTPWEEERLELFVSAELARRHRAAGLRLNHPEAVALICDAMLEAARAGASFAEVEAAGRAAVGAGEVLDGVRELVDEVRLEVLLDEGTRLVVLADPLGDGPGSGPHDEGPGAVVPDGAPGREPAHHRERIEIDVRNTSRRVVRVSSHYPFHRVNPRLQFDRALADGFRLDLPAGAWVGWAPGEAKVVRLVRFGGTLGSRR